MDLRKPSQPKTANKIDKALIFKKSDVEDLREKLQEACDHPEMVMKMKNQAADFICEKYNWDEVVKKTMKLYRRK